jgi:hypothetical protein
MASGVIPTLPDDIVESKVNTFEDTSEEASADDVLMTARGGYRILCDASNDCNRRQISNGLPRAIECDSK